MDASRPTYSVDGTGRYVLDELSPNRMSLKSDTLKPELSDFDVAQRLIAEECDALKELLLAKNKKYGNSAIDPIRVFSNAAPLEQIKVRMDDKLSRIRNATLSGQKDNEDAKQDLMGYLILERVAERMHRGDY